ncbi:5229_t:CDS:2, partial [Dentiscutata heterogama]
DLALREEFWNLYGFKKSDVELLLDNAFGNGFLFDAKEGVIKWLKEEFGGYFFNPDQPEGVFNTASSSLSFRSAHTALTNNVELDYQQSPWQIHSYRSTQSTFSRIQKM